MNKRKNIALFMAILENDFSNAVLEGAVKGAKECGANLVVFPMDLIKATYANNTFNACRYQYNILEHYMGSEDIDGIVIEYGTIVSALDEDEKKKFLALAGNTPTVVLTEPAEGYRSATVNNKTGMQELLEHLICEHGYTKIGYLSGTKGNADAEERLEVYRDTLLKHGLEPDEDWIAYGNFSVYVEDIVTELINKHMDMEVLVCANDAMAIGASWAMGKLGIEPGKDIFLTGFDDISAGFLMDPALTTVKAEPSDLSYEAVKKLCMNDNDFDSFKISSKALIRESCGCCDYVLEDSWKKKLGISSNWRTIAQNQMSMENDRRGLEHELGEVTRELIFTRSTEKDRYEAILETLKRLTFTNANLFLYDKFINHNFDDEWINPEHCNMVGYYTQKDGGINHTYKNGDVPIETQKLVGTVVVDDGHRHDVLVLPLFFAQSQIGILAVENEHKRFLSAYFMAGQISTTLYIIAMNEEQKRIEKELEEASESKSQFVANMSHEIRTPINAIIGFNEMILKENQDDTISEYARDVKHAANSLLTLVNDVLDFSKIEAGKMNLVMAEYSLHELVNSVVVMENKRAESKGLALFLEFDRNLPDVLFGDSNRIQQILLNIVSNAIKYTESGTVKVCVSGKREKENLLLSIAVKDTGIGIKKEDLGRLFTKFDRIDEKKNRNIEGTGLGLNITIGLLELMGSKLNVESEYGVGSVFSFEIWQRIIAEAKEPGEKVSQDKDNKAHYQAPDARVLVVDDNSMNRRVVISLLKETKIIVDQADSGKACIEMASKNHYDIILLDHMMPEMDGIETIEKMLEMRLYNPKKTAVIALTANALFGVKNMYLDKGFTDYLAKPVIPRDLYDTLLKYLPNELVIK